MPADMHARVDTFYSFVAIKLIHRESHSIHNIYKECYSIETFAVAFNGVQVRARRI